MMAHEVTYTLPSDGFKSFIGAIHAINKIGKEISFEADSNGLILRTLNDAHSASGEFGFTRACFSSIVWPMAYETQILKCKVFVKTCQMVFRSIKRVEQIEIVFWMEDGALCQLRFRLRCEEHLTKTHHLRISECPSLRAAFDKENAPNR